MGNKVTFSSDGHTCEGYLALPEEGKGPAVVVIQEWWGLVPHIEDVADRFAREGFLALAPDLYHGKTTKSPDTASKLLMELDAGRAEKEIAGAGDHLLSLPGCTSRTFGVVGFCMGGGLAQYSATKNPKVGAGVSFYGGFIKVEYDWKNLGAPLLLIYGETDRGVPPAQAAPLQEKLRGMGKDVTAIVYPEAGHAFFNDTRPDAHHKTAAEDAWKRTIDFFRKHLA